MTDAPFFIVGSPRSGTTLLEQLVNRHSRLYVPPETAFFHLLNRHGLLPSESAAGGIESFVNAYLHSSAAHLLNLGDGEIVQEQLLENARCYADVFSNLLDILKKISGKPRIGEKTPHHLRVADYIAQQLPDAKFIAVIRDGRSVVKSRMNHPGWEHNLLAAARIWSDDAKLLRKLLNCEHAARVHLIRYEQLVTDPESVLRGICDFLGEGYEDSMLREKSQAENVPRQHSEYYQQDWMAKSTTPPDPERAHAWKVEYSQSELSLVERIEASDLAYFEYQLYSTRSGWLPLYIKEFFRHALFRIGRHVRISKHYAL